jgi:shikimate dehydrogenase
MPLKEVILDLVADRDPLVDVLQAANTVYRRGASVVLSNTDAYGVQRALEHFDIAPRTAWVLGAGATARAVSYGLMQRGTSEVVLMVRDLDRAAPTVDALSTWGLSVQARHLSDISLHTSPDIVVSSVPGGAEGLPEFPPAITESAALFDVAYSPWPSHIATQWSSSTFPLISGLWMLAFQALAQLRLFVNADVTQALDQEDRVVSAMLRSVGLDSGSPSSAGMEQ